MRRAGRLPPRPGAGWAERVGANVACRTEGRARTEGWARSARPVGAVRALSGPVDRTGQINQGISPTRRVGNLPTKTRRDEGDGVRNRPPYSSLDFVEK